MDVKVELLKEGENAAGDGGAEEHEVKTKTYVYTAGSERLKKEEWDYEDFRKEKMHNWTDESFEYEGESWWNLWNRGAFCWRGKEVDAAVAGFQDAT